MNGYLTDWLRNFLAPHTSPILPNLPRVLVITNAAANSNNYIPSASCVTRSTSSRVVMPSVAVRKPSSRSVLNPVLTAAAFRDVLGALARAYGARTPATLTFVHTTASLTSSPRHHAAERSIRQPAAIMQNILTAPTSSHPRHGKPPPPPGRRRSA